MLLTGKLYPGKYRFLLQHEENMDQQTQCAAFQGPRLIAAGPLAQVAARAKAVADSPDHPTILIFDDATSELIELDFRGTVAEVVGRLPVATPAAAVPEPARGPGRPKLGVVAREVTLLPRHWDWLSGQPGGASVTLRKLVEQARRASEGPDRLRQSRDALYRFISVMAGDAPDFEEATRALYAGDRARFLANTRAWPADVSAHALHLAARAFEPKGEAS
jgi:hypothetical protein